MCPPHGTRGKKALQGIFCKGANLIHGDSPSMIYSCSEAFLHRNVTPRVEILIHEYGVLGTLIL